MVVILSYNYTTKTLLKFTALVNKKANLRVFFMLGDLLIFLSFILFS